MKIDKKHAVLTGSLSSMERLYFSLGCEKDVDVNNITSKLQNKDEVNLDFPNYVEVMGVIQNKVTRRKSSLF